MKRISIIGLSAFTVLVLLVFQNCGSDDKETDKERTLRILQSKAWTVSSVNVPLNTATESVDWVNFTVSFTASNMTAAQHPTGAQAVWPSGIYTVSEDGSSVTRADGVVMVLNPISDTNFTAIFNVPPGTDIGGRIAALDGEYTFNMK